MPQHVLEMLDNLIENGTSNDTKVLAEGVKASLKILSEDVVPEIQASCAHRKDKDLHTPKGILVRTKVIAWCVIIMILISTIVMYIPQAVEYLIP